MEIFETPHYTKWFSNLRDRTAKIRIAARLRVVASSGALTGDVKPVGGGVFELRFHVGPGYRVYVLQQGSTLLLLLIGGDKSSQIRNIAKAQILAKEWKDDHGY